MRARIAKRSIILILGLTIIVSADFLTMLIIYRGIAVLNRSWQVVRHVEEPTSAAAYEMEINVLGTGFGVLKYLDTRDPRYRDRVEDDTGDFARFHAQYLSLADSEKDEELAETIRRL
jgi:hypothetical protein